MDFSVIIRDTGYDYWYHKDTRTVVGIKLLEFCSTVNLITQYYMVTKSKKIVQ